MPRRDSVRAEEMAAVSPRHDQLARDTKQMLWWLSMYNTACGVAIQKMPYARVRQLIGSSVDSVKEPMEEGEGFSQFQSGASQQMQQLMGSMTHLCRDAALANESVRVLFSSPGGRSLKAVLYAATKLRPQSADPKSTVKMAYAGVLTTCDYVEEDALATTGATARLEKHLKGNILESHTAFVDVVCSTARSRVGRALLAQLLIDLKRSRSRDRKHAVVTVAVSNEGRDLFRSFDFSELRFKGHHLMFVMLRDVTFETLTTALRFEGSDEYMGVCFRHGLTGPSKDKVYPTGCL